MAEVGQEERRKTRGSVLAGVSTLVRGRLGQVGLSGKSQAHLLRPILMGSHNPVVAREKRAPLLSVGKFGE